MTKPRLQTGCDRLSGPLRRQLAGRRVALVSHQAAVSRAGDTTAQRLKSLLGDRLVALMGPEHGFFAQAGPGARLSDAIHPDWGIPIYSLYGDQREVTPEMLQGVDAVVVDFQDLGLRCYTYLATLFGVMRACEQAGIELFVADRPVPMANCVDGPMPTADGLSFVCPAMLPFCHGMTQGEAARWYAQTRGHRTMPRIIRMLGYGRDSAPRADWPEWLPPSPAIRAWENALCYPITVFSEAFPRIDVGRSSSLAFRVLGATGLRGTALCERLSAWRLPGVAFHPHRFDATLPSDAGRVHDGLRISVTDPRRYAPLRTALVLLREISEIWGDERLWDAPGVSPAKFDGLFGSPAARLSLRSGQALSQIWRQWTRDQRAFRSARRDALLYAAAGADS